MQPSLPFLVAPVIILIVHQSVYSLLGPSRSFSPCSLTTWWRVGAFGCGLVYGRWLASFPPEVLTVTWYCSLPSWRQPRSDPMSISSSVLTLNIAITGTPRPPDLTEHDVCRGRELVFVFCCLLLFCVPNIRSRPLLMYQASILPLSSIPHKELLLANRMST